MKKKLNLFILIGLLIITLCSCSSSSTTTNTSSDETLPPNQFDFTTRTVKLNDGKEMPIIGIGTYTLTNEEASNSVYWALKYGYRLIDTAARYGNEEGVGEGIRRAIEEGIVTRDDVFVTTKLWPNNFSPEDVDLALEKLGLDYIDLMLIHQPDGEYIAGWRNLEKAVEEGKIRSIGVSNFNKTQFQEVLDEGEIIPVVNQIETHPFYQEIEMQNFLYQYDCFVEAWFPLGGRSHTSDVLGNETIVRIAEEHDKSPAQIVLRWHIQAGHIVIPGSSNEEHIKENIDIFNFELTKQDMEDIAKLDTLKSYGGRDYENE